VGRAQHPGGGAVAAGRERAGVAVRQRPVARLEPLRAELRQPPVDRLALGRERLGGRHRPGRAAGVEAHPHALDRMAQVDRRRPRRQQRLGAGVEVAGARRERGPVCRRDPDRRRSPHRHRPDRLGDLRSALAAQPALLAGQPPLVEHEQRILLESQRRDHPASVAVPQRPARRRRGARGA
jgi:hypothetical protein